MQGTSNPIGIPNRFWQKPLLGKQIGCVDKLGKETVAGAHRGKNGTRSMMTQGMLRMSGSAQGRSPSALVKAAAAHVQRLKRNRLEKNSHRV